MDLDPTVSLDDDVTTLSNRWMEYRKLKCGVKCWTPWLKEVQHIYLCGHWRWRIGHVQVIILKGINFVLFYVFFPVGAQLIAFGKVELESVVPNSYPETFIHVRGQLTRRGSDLLLEWK